jgi:DNA-binding transcriptional MerR regulator
MIRQMRTLPFGYRAKGDRVVSDPTEQKALGVIRKLRAKGQTLEDIAQALSDQGYKPREAEQWNTRALRQILARENGAGLRGAQLRKRRTST